MPHHYLGAASRKAVPFRKRNRAADRKALARIGLGKSPSTPNNLPPGFVADDHVSEIKHGLFWSRAVLIARCSRRAPAQRASGKRVRMQKVRRNVPRFAGLLRSRQKHVQGTRPAFPAFPFGRRGAVMVFDVMKKRSAEARHKKAQHAKARRKQAPSASRKQAESPEAPRRWSAEVTRRSNALDLEPGVFTRTDPKEIAASLKRSAETSLRKKTDSYRSALSMLSFYINRAGTNLSEMRRRILMRAKAELRKQFGR